MLRSEAEQRAMRLHKRAKHMQTLGRTVLHLNIKIGFDRLDVGATDSIPASECLSRYSVVHNHHMLLIH